MPVLHRVKLQDSDMVKDTVRYLLALQQAEQEVAVSTKVVKTDNEILGCFINEIV